MRCTPRPSWERYSPCKPRISYYRLSTAESRCHPICGICAARACGPCHAKYKRYCGKGGCIQWLGIECASQLAMTVRVL